MSIFKLVTESSVKLGNFCINCNGKVTLGEMIDCKGTCPICNHKEEGTSIVIVKPKYYKEVTTKKNLLDFNPITSIEFID